MISPDRLRAWWLAIALTVTGTAFTDAPQREVYFGETHLHTTWSIDAFAISGSTYNGPEEAYRYARGKTIDHPAGYPIRITKPLDWIAITEHAEYMGAFMLAAEPDSILEQRHPVWATALDMGAGVEPLAAYMLLAKSIVNESPIDAFRDEEIMRTLWHRLVAIADEHYEPGKFTTFPAYEWTAQPGNKNMHRNVIFRDSDNVPDVILDAISADDPHDLWTWMDEQRAKGNELLAIPHNGNLSDGLMFPTDSDLAGRPIDAAWAASRMRNEPLVEIKQGKGTSETTPALSPKRRICRIRTTRVEASRRNRRTAAIRKLRPAGLPRRADTSCDKRRQPIQDGCRRGGRIHTTRPPVTDKKTTSACTGAWTGHPRCV